ncbi:MAG: tetratricopeptide repeat protein [Acidimicrobiales bacterium]
MTSVQPASCVEPGCSGAIAADGYCDTCGTRAAPAGAPAAVPGPSSSPVPPSAGSPSPSPSVAAPAVLGGPVSPPPASPSAGQPGAIAVGALCGRAGCTGAIAADGYCDTCGLAAESSGSVPVPPLGSLADPGDAPSLAAPEAPSTSSRVQGAGTATAQSRRTVTATTRTASTRTGIGAGLVAVPATPVGDPATAVMTEDDVRAVLGEVPEEERVCSSCGRPVGRTDDGRPGRVRGFCGSCRTPFDFVTNEPSLHVGELVGGQYEILGPLAHGGMGWIYLGKDRAVSDRWVVLKGLLNESDPDAVLAAVAERQFLAEIDHPSIVNIYNFVTHRGAGYIVMEMVGGESLNQKLKKRRAANGGVANPLPPAEAIAYILGILPAFGYLHEQGLVYNDLKPANIMAVADGVKLIDVGAVMRIDDQHAAIFGTQGFQAPEVAAAGPSIASDLYTVGRTLAVLMLNFVFHDGPYLYGLPPRDEQPLFSLWESLHRFLLRACAHHPDDRFQSAGEMAEQLTGVLREIVAVSDGRPRTATSALFEGDQLANLLVGSAEAYDTGVPDWRVLPSSRVNEEDPAAAFLLGLPERDPERSMELLGAAIDSGRVDASPEVVLHRARELVQTGLDPAPSLAEVERANPWEWRVQWYRAIHLLQQDRAEEAAELFSRVWTELPGESAPKLAVGLAAEMAGEYERAAEVYDLVVQADASYVSAAFGLARCRLQQGDPRGVVDAYNRVPPSSAAHAEAQVASARALVSGGPGGRPTVAELQAASATIERLQLDAAERATLSADVYERALAGLSDGSIPADSTTMLGYELNERALRRGLEKAYRELARYAHDDGERIRLIDRANVVRPRSLV